MRAHYCPFCPYSSRETRVLYGSGLIHLTLRQLLTILRAFDAQLDGKDDFARQCVHQALLLQYCRALGRDGVALFFKRITTKGHQAQDVFVKDVRDTYHKIKARATEINKQRAAAGEGSSGVEQIQLHAVDPGTVINIRGQSRQFSKQIVKPLY